MCRVLPVSHISCTHTIFIWQHCIDATRYGINGQSPCCNVQQHDQVVFTRKLCENCGGERYFARRGGVAERGNGTSPSTLKDDGKDDQEDANDSGYNSDVIHEEEEGSDLDDLPISPKAVTPQRLRTKQRIERKRRASSNSRSLTRRPSWKPNLKRELTLDDVPTMDRTRRDSIDSLISNFDGSIWHESREQQLIAEKKVDATTSLRDPNISTQTSAIRKHRFPKRRLSTLLHPSSPSVEITVGVQTARAFAFPQLVDIQKSSDGSSPRTPTKKKSSLMHPSTPVEEDVMELYADFSDSFPTANPEGRAARRDSTLLHPFPMADLSSTGQHRTAIPVPAKQQDTPESLLPTLLHLPPSPSSLRQFSSPPARRLPTLSTDMFASVSSTPAKTPRLPLYRPRRESILHSSLSDTEDDPFEDSPQSSPRSDFDFPLDTHNARYANTLGNTVIQSSSEGHDADDAEGAILTNTARAARASRRGVRQG